LRASTSKKLLAENSFTFPQKGGEKRHSIVIPSSIQRSTKGRLDTAIRCQVVRNSGSVGRAINPDCFFFGFLFLEPSV
jgi:hypothetical protein